MMARKRIGQLLVDAGVIDEHQLRSALAEQRKWGHPLGRTLVEMGLLSEKMMMQGLSHQLNLPLVDLESKRPEPSALELLDVEFCQRNICLPFHFQEAGRFLDVAMADPTNMELFDQIRVKTRCNVRPHLAGPVAIDSAIRQGYLGEPLANARQAEWQLDERVLDLDTGQRRRRTATGPVEPLVRPIAATPSQEYQVASGSAIHEALADLRESISELRALIERDEKVLRRLMGLLVEKGVCSREELLARISES